MKSVLLGKFARDGARDFSDEVWLQTIFEGSSRKKSSTVKIKMEFHVICELFKGILLVFLSSHS